MAVDHGRPPATTKTPLTGRDHHGERWAGVSSTLARDQTGVGLDRRDCESEDKPATSPGVDSAARAGTAIDNARSRALATLTAGPAIAAPPLAPARS
ncbi:hypothetical protein CDL15_Pgr006111 [Punica granatum]|uniref:Uncharacterized protein n=1 Tax=Punica granatum TaxID=22663 RepID=A0A218VU91_PUNGR|nr:hypothetical protein CDL15_Pgr006111 [Punica granatum]PKI68066.1 hypothetical protein CRG98_011662 [Punica granatum]